MDPLSLISGVTGLVVAAVSTTQALITLIQDLKDAPAEIRQLQEELTSLSSVLQSTELLCNTYDFRVEDATLVAAVRNCVQSNSDAMASLKATLEPFAQQGSWRRGPVRAMSWTLRKGEIRSHRSRFRDQAASLTLAVSVLNGYSLSWQLFKQDKILTATLGISLAKATMKSETTSPRAMKSFQLNFTALKRAEDSKRDWNQTSKA